MNIFFVLRKNDGSGDVELVTAPLTRGDILAGVTRDSILHLSRGWEEEENKKNSGDGNSSSSNSKAMSVSERWLTMGEVVQAQKEGRVS